MIDPALSFIYGSGGHAKVVMEAWRLTGGRLAGCFDDDPRRQATTLLDVPVGAFCADKLQSHAVVHVAIGDNESRIRIGRGLALAGLRVISVVHPESVISVSAILEHGCFIAARAIVGPCTQLGQFVIVNHAAVIDHDCEIGAGVHVAPGSVVGGGVKIGEAVLLGSGAIVLPGVSIGDHAVVGAGAVVTRDVIPGVTVVGVPARILDTAGRAR